jgi:hypothetical protein
MRANGTIYGFIDANEKRPYISPTDIAQVADNVLTDPDEKHAMQFTR